MVIFCDGSESNGDENQPSGQIGSDEDAFHRIGMPLTLIQGGHKGHHVHNQVTVAEMRMQLFPGREREENSFENVDDERKGEKKEIEGERKNRRDRDREQKRSQVEKR